MVDDLENRAEQQDENNNFQESNIDPFIPLKMLVYSMAGGCALGFLDYSLGFLKA